MGTRRAIATLWIITKRELSLYFISPIFYFLGASFLFLASLFFVQWLGVFNQGQAPPDMRGTLGNVSIIMLFLAPLLTMRLIADETRQGTLELLLTRPVRDWQIVVGKFLGAWGVFSILLLIISLYPLILIWRGNPDTGAIFSGYLGLWLMSGAMIAVGVFMSALTQYQMVAAILTFGALLGLWLADILSPLVDLFASGTSGSFRTIATQFVDTLTIRNHFIPSMLRGILNSTDIAYFVFLMALSLFPATRVLEARRWRS